MYVKLFQQILDSTINDALLSRRWTWITLLLLADQDGNFTATPQAIARRANLSVDDVSDALDYLQQPDPTSTSPDDAGRRLIQVSSNCWHIVNYAKYRLIATAEDGRQKARARMRAMRSGTEQCTPHARQCSVSFGNVRECSPLEADAEANSNTESEANTVAIEGRPAHLRVPATRRSPDEERLVVERKNDDLRRVTLDEQTWRFEGIAQQDRDEWRQLAPHVNIDRELVKLITYCQEHPAWARKRFKGGRWLSTIRSWLLKAQEYAEKDSTRERRAGPRQPKEIPPGCDQYGHEFGAVTWARNNGILQEIEDVR